MSLMPSLPRGVLQCAVVCRDALCCMCCSVLQHVAVCCSVLQCILQSVAVYCSVLGSVTNEFDAMASSQCIA